MNVKGLLPVLLLSVAVPADAGERISLRVTPAVSLAPANLLVRATVESNKENRSIEIIAESDDFYRSSEVALDGDRAPRITVMHFNSVPGGNYEVRVVVKGVTGAALAAAVAAVRIVPQQEP
jgi:hypothetical protein